MDWRFLLPILIGVAISALLWSLAVLRKREDLLASATLRVVCVVGLLNLLLVVVRAHGPEPLQQTARFALEAADVITGLVLGVMLVPCMAWILDLIDSKTARVVAIAASLYVATSFLGFEVGKAAHDAEMRQFFASSGLPIWFMYAVMAVESAAAIGLLMARTRAPSAATLLVIMLGAVGTHLRNGDAIQDSHDALRMLVLLATILLLSGRRRRRCPA